MACKRLFMMILSAHFKEMVGALGSASVYVALTVIKRVYLLDCTLYSNGSIHRTGIVKHPRQIGCSSLGALAKLRV